MEINKKHIFLKYKLNKPLHKSCVLFFPVSMTKRHGAYSFRKADCSSTSYRFRICNLNMSLRKSIYRMWVSNKYSRSPCWYGTSFGFVGNTIWVNHGCRAKFTLAIRPFDHGNFIFFFPSMRHK